MFAVFLLSGLQNPDLFEFVDGLNIKNKIQEYYCSPKFQTVKKKFSLWSLESQYETTLSRFPCSDRIVREVE